MRLSLQSNGARFSSRARAKNVLNNQRDSSWRACKAGQWLPNYHHDPGGGEWGELVGEFELGTTFQKGWIGAGARQPADLGTAGQIYMARSNNSGAGSFSEAEFTYEDDARQV